MINSNKKNGQNSELTQIKEHGEPHQIVLKPFRA